MLHQVQSCYTCKQFAHTFPENRLCVHTLYNIHYASKTCRTIYSTIYLYWFSFCTIWVLQNVLYRLYCNVVKLYCKDTQSSYFLLSSYGFCCHSVCCTSQHKRTNTHTHTQTDSISGSQQLHPHNFRYLLLFACFQQIVAKWLGKSFMAVIFVLRTMGFVVSVKFKNNSTNIYTWDSTI